MNINWYGQSCFQVSSSQGKNNHVSIVIDPFDETTGLRVPKLQADIVLVTHEHSDHNNVKAVSGEPFIIEGPGEYDIKGSFIQGISGYHDNTQGAQRGSITIYTIETEGMRLCHLSDLGQKELSPSQLDKIGDIDILMIPIGGIYTIDAAEAVKIMAQIEPRVIIPMHYKIPKLKIKLDDVDKFLKNLGMKKPESLPKLSIRKKDISTEEAKIIILQP
ncbi:MBL fold metallo-hydrolase [Patescibacteria group bacterium]|nr:MBL fold metallo-hydrolase [Patescibacteria group bacterium]